MSEEKMLNQGWFIRHRTITKSVAPTSVAIFPFFLGSLIRMASLGWTWNTFNAGDLAIGVTFLTLYSIQELMGAKPPPLTTEEKRHETNAQLTIAFLFAMALVALFALIVNGNVSQTNPNILHAFDVTVYFVAPFLVVHTSQMRDHFRPYDD